MTPFRGARQRQERTVAGACPRRKEHVSVKREADEKKLGGRGIELFSIGRDRREVEWGKGALSGTRRAGALSKVAYLLQIASKPSSIIFRN